MKNRIQTFEQRPKRWFRELWGRLLCIATLLTGLATVSKGVIIYDNFATTYGPAGYVLTGSPEFYSYQVYKEPAKQVYVAELWTKQKFTHPSSPDYEADADLRQSFEYHNDTTQPPTGDYQGPDPDNWYNLIRKFIERQSDPPRPKTPGDGGGVRGSLDLGPITLDTIVLEESSPDWVSFMDAHDNPWSIVPFFVTAAGDGDSLSIYDNRGLLWHQPLAQFTLGELYLAAIPKIEDADPRIPNLTTFWLNSVGDANASVIFATSGRIERVNENFSTMTNLAMGLAALLSISVYRGRIGDLRT